MILFLLILNFSYCKQEQYETTLTYEQYQVISFVVIREYKHKQCWSSSSYSANLCQKYCQNYYHYVPSLPYKNAMHFNIDTLNCQPKIICPKSFTVYYNAKKNKCIDYSSDMSVPGVDAQPYNPSRKKVDVLVICEHGRTTTYLGLTDCQCDFGYTTKLSISLAEYSHGRKVITKCNHHAELALYFDKYMQIYYDPAIDNSFPLAYDPDYWTRALLYYARQAKYTVTTFFVPWQVQIVTITLPQQPLVNKQGFIVLIWSFLLFLLICLVTCYEKNVNGTTLEQHLMRDQ